MSADTKKTPKVPEGWLAKFDDKYKTWFYVDLSTKRSQWEAPPGTTFTDPSDVDDVPPPAYSPNGSSRASVPAAVAGSSAGANFSPQPNQRVNMPQSQGSAPQAYPHQGYGGHPQQSPYGGYPPQGYGGYPPQQPYGGYPPQQPYGAYPQQPIQQPARKSRFGGGTGLAMGLGGGMLGGMLLGDALSDSQNDAYMDGYQDGQDNDFGGGDFGGGDF